MIGRLEGRNGSKTAYRMRKLLQNANAQHEDVQWIQPAETKQRKTPDAESFDEALPVGGRWWMLTNIDEAETGDHCSELYLFSADSPLSTNWVPHPQNPILVDSIGGRNGGLIIDGERLVRLGQCQGVDQYGQSLRVYEIKDISQSHYADELVAEIKPNFRKGIVGTHHLATDGRITVIDHASGFLVA